MDIKFIVISFDFILIRMDKIIDYKILSSLSNEMKQLIIDIAIESYIKGLSDGINEKEDNEYVVNVAREIGYEGV